MRTSWMIVVALACGACSSGGSESEGGRVPAPVARPAVGIGEHGPPGGRREIGRLPAAPRILLDAPVTGSLFAEEVT